MLHFKLSLHYLQISEEADDAHVKAVVNMFKCNLRNIKYLMWIPNELNSDKEQVNDWGYHILKKQIGTGSLQIIVILCDINVVCCVIKW